MARRRYGRKLSALTQSKLRSALTNGSVVLNGVDHRVRSIRRLKDLLAAHIADLGGDDLLSEAQRCIVRRAAMLELQLEMMESSWSANGGEASAKQIEVYQRATNTLRRCVESLGLNAGRKPREINALDDPAWRAYEKEMRAP
jgi:hypothetical protein